MKCPKCGSEMLLTNEQSVALNTDYEVDRPLYLCSCGNSITYQARLDKVLEKLKELKGYISKNIYLTYSEKIKKFVVWEILDISESMIFQTHFSLDTVESLLKDLEQ